jgi:hypothetical protein
MEELGIGGQIARTGTGFAGNHEHSHLGPALPDKARELEAIDGARHVYIREDDGDVGPALQQLECLVGILRLDDPELGLSQNIDLGQTNERLVFDEENDWLLHDSAVRFHAP